MKSKFIPMPQLLFKPSAKPWTPHNYQKRAIKFLIGQAAAGLFLDPGLGKTSISLGAIKILKSRGLIGKVLIIAPLRVCHSTWPNELQKWTDFSGLTCAILHGKDKDQRLHDDVDLYIINPEGLDWLLKPTKTKVGKRTRVTVDVKAFKRLGFDTLLVDELTKFKNYQAIKFKALKQVLGTFSRRWGLTGSPAANGLGGLFGQMYVLDQGRSLGQYVTHFRDKYFTPSFNGFSYDLIDGAEEQIYKQISPVVLRMADSDYLELPQLVENIIDVEIPPKAREVYDALENELLATIESKQVTAKNSGVALGKCRQVASGAIYLEAGLGEVVKVKPRGKRDWAEVHEAKLDALEDLVDELQGKPAIIVYEFHHDFERIVGRLGDLPHIGSGVSMARGKLLEAQWNAGQLPLLLAHPASIAHGLNLQGSGQHIIWFTLTWDYELFDQLIRRLRRQGSTHKRIFNHILVAKDSVEEVVLGAIRAKRRGQNALFDGLRDLQRRRSPRK